MTPTERSRSRFYTDLYDSVSQRRIVGLGLKPDALVPVVLGSLRLNAILSRTIVLTDAQILDGTFFFDLGLTPTEVLAAIAREQHTPAPIEIRARSAHLSDALVGFLKRSNEQTLRGFAFSAIPDDAARKTVSAELAKVPSSRVRSWKDIVPVLRDAGVSDERADQLQATWAEWVSLAASRRLSVAPWEGQFSLKQKVDELRPTEIVTREGLEALRLVEAFWGDRSRLDNEISALATDTTEDAALRELRSVEGSYHRAYNWTVSSQHECDCFESTFDNAVAIAAGAGPPAPLREAAPLEPSIDSLLPALPPDFVLRLGALDDEAYRALVSTHRAKMIRWWEGDARSGIEALGGIMDGVLNAGISAKRSETEAGFGAVKLVLALIGGSGGDPLLAGGCVVLGAGIAAVQYWYNNHFAKTSFKGHAQRAIKVLSESHHHV